LLLATFTAALGFPVADAPAAGAAPLVQRLINGGCDSVWEGNSGLTTMTCWLDLSDPSNEATVVRYSTLGGTAVPEIDYVPAEGTLTFEPGVTHVTATLAIVGDTHAEGIDSLTLRLGTSAGVAVQEMTSGYIVNDDPEPVGADLSNGFMYRGSLMSEGPDRHVDFFRAGLHHPASYEAVVDEVSGDLLPLMLEIPGALRPQHGEPVGVGAALSLRFDTSPYGVPAALPVAVYSGGCGLDCGLDDTYRLRFYETTLSGARINNAGTTRTVLIIQNPSDRAVTGRVHFWTEDGGYAAMRTFDLAPRASLALDTTEPMPDGSGAVTVTHDAPYGVLQGKAITFDTTTGFSSDSFLQPKLR